MARPDWDAASIDATRNSLLSIVRDPRIDTLVKFTEDLKKRGTRRGTVFWDDERASYSFTVTDSGKFIDIDFEKPFPAGAFLKDLGITEVTFEKPCDANHIKLCDARGQALKYGMWSLSEHNVR